jgi:hypothetical protein
LGKAGSAATLNQPAYLDLVYLPHHGNPSYADADFFKWIRSRNYVLSGLNPTVEILDAILDGKKSWAQSDKEVLVIPTYDSETLRLWLALHGDDLAAEHIDIAPSAMRCMLNLQDATSGCPAFRLEF